MKPYNRPEESRPAAASDHRDTAAAAAAMVGFGPFRLDPVKRRLYRHNTLLSLSSKAMDALLVLIERRGQVVDKNELMEHVWPKTYVSEDSVAQCISALRHALGDDAAHPEFVLTMPRRGYQFIAAVEAIADEATPLTPSAAAMMSPAAPAASPRLRPWMRMMAVFAVVLAMALSSGVVFFGRSAATAPRSIQFREVAPRGATLSGDAAVSPDGRYLAYVASNDAGRPQLWLRRLDAIDPQPLPGTEGAALPFWSPDTRSIGFFADRWLKVLTVANGVVRPLTQVLLIPTGGSWSTQDLILYGTRHSPLHAIAAAGGAVTAVTTLDRPERENGHALPQFLPDGRRFLYSVVSRNPARAGLYVGSLDAADTRWLLDDSHAAVTFSPTGHLIYLKDEMLMAQAFDPVTLSLTGRPVPLAEAPLPWDRDATTISVSETLLAVAGRAAERQLRWYDRSGRALGAVDAARPLHTPALSADGSQLVASSDDPQVPGIWIVDLVRGGSSRLVPDGLVPLWSPRGDRVAYASHRRAGVLDIYVKSLATDGTDRLLLQNEQSKGVTDWSADGQYLVVQMANAQQDIDIWLLDATTGDARPWLQTSVNELQGRLSPDGRWLAYASDETGRLEVYLQSFPAPGIKRAISIAGGAQPSWRDDGEELYYLSPEGDLMAVEVIAGGARLGRPRPLFRAPVSTDLVRRRNLYAPAADGRRFLVDTTEMIDGGVVSILAWRARVEGD